jgi:hypothetical protein
MLLISNNHAKTYFGFRSADENAVLEQILNKQGERVWTVFNWLRINLVVGFINHSNTFLDSI